MSPMTRRQLLLLGAAGAGTAAVGGVGLWWSGAGGTRGGTVGRTGGGAGDELIQPQVLASSGGVLALDLEAAPARVRIGNRTAAVHAFNGSLPGPTLRVRPGDTIRVRLRNGLRDPTNLHVHGLHVSPTGNGDNPFVSIAPGGSFDYEFALPDNHPVGTFWYHPHHHGHVAEQLASGLYGAIVVEDTEPVPVTRERVLVVSDLSLDASGNLATVSPMDQMMGREGEIVLVNGQVRPRLTARPGERERWRIINACPARYLRLRLDGQTMRLLGRDGDRVREPADITQIELAPGNRVDLLVETRAATATLVATPVDRGSVDSMMGRGAGRAGAGETVNLLTLDVSGESVPAAPPVPTGPVLRDLRQEPIAGRRTFDFAMGMGMGGLGGGGMGPGGGGGMMSFTINGQQFAMGRLDTAVVTGSVEEWTLTNSSTMDHPLHLHVWPMQVVQDGTRNLTEPTWQDVVNIPAGGRVQVLVAFDDFDGRTVYHCHILDHEDLGMMGTIEASPA